MNNENGGRQMSRLPLREWWTKYQYTTENGHKYDTGKPIFATSLVEARNIAFVEAMENEILISVEPIEEQSSRNPISR